MKVLSKIIKNSFSVTNQIKGLRKIKPEKWQRKTLVKLLNKAKNTEFGKKYNFNEILDSETSHQDNTYYQNYQKFVPIYDYNKMYNEWWFRSYAGESDITWPDKVKYFALSSGTSESTSKKIPVSKEMIKEIRKNCINHIISSTNFAELPTDIFEKDFMMLGGSTDLKSKDDHLEGDLSGITATNIPFWFEKYYKPGKIIAYESNWEAKLDRIAECAHEWDIAFIAGVPAWIQLLLERIIEKNNLKTIHDLWPNLHVFVWGGVSFEPYKKGFEKLLNPSVPFHYIETYLASEGYIAYQTHPGQGLQLLLKNGIFFEFVPFDEDNFDNEGNIIENPETLQIEDVKNNVEYALLISTCSGAWRYLIGDTIKFIDKSNAAIVITGRTKHYVSLCGEHLSIENMNKAIEIASKHFGICIREFTIAGIKHQNMFAHQWYIGTDEMIDQEELALFIDKTLQSINDDYAVERMHALKDVFCKVLSPEVFMNWMQSKEKMGGQHKFPRVLKGAALDDWKIFIEEHHRKKITNV